MRRRCSHYKITILGIKVDENYYYYLSKFENLKAERRKKFLKIFN